MIKRIDFRKFLIKTAIFVLLFFLASGLGFIWHQVNAGFNLHKLYSILPDNSSWSISYSSKEMEDVKKILDQEFFYLGKGRQSFVFVSKDQKYVIKFFRYHLVKPKFWYSFLNNTALKEHIQRRKKKLQAWMESYKLANEKLREETGLIYVHLVRTDEIGQSIKLRDNLRRLHEVDLDKVGFLVQKKAALFFDTVKDLIKNQDLVALKKLFPLYLKSLASSYQKGIKNKDHSWMDNSGNIGLEEVLEIDVGRYSSHLPAKDEKELLEMLLYYTRSFRFYLEQKVPAILPDFDRELKNTANAFFPERQHVGY